MTCIWSIPCTSVYGEEQNPGVRCSPQIDSAGDVSQARGPWRNPPYIFWKHCSTLDMASFLPVKYNKAEIFHPPCTCGALLWETTSTSLMFPQIPLLQELPQANSLPRGAFSSVFAETPSPSSRFAAWSMEAAPLAQHPRHYWGFLRGCQLWGTDIRSELHGCSVSQDVSTSSVSHPERWRPKGCLCFWCLQMLVVS